MKERIGRWLLGTFESYGAYLEAAMIASGACAIAMSLYYLWVSV